MRTCHYLLAALFVVWTQALSAPTALGQFQQQSPSVHQNFGQNQRIKLIAGTSRVIKFDFDVPGVVIGNPEVVDAQPVSSNQIMITGRRPGVSGISVSDAENNQHTLDILVVGDSRQLQLTLDELFPNASIRAFPLNTNVVLTGHVARESQIRQAEQVAQDFFPNGVRNLLTLGGPKKIALECKVVEVSRTKLRDMGIDWSLATSGFTLQNSAGALLDGGTGAGNFFFRIVDGSDQFPFFLNLLRQNNLAKILTQPTVVTMPGRPASLLNGGLIPIPINSGLGVQSVEFREFGTKLDVLPMLEGDGRIRVEVRAEVTDVAPDLAVNGTPGFRSRNVDTGVPLREGQTLALAGLIQSRTDSVSRGIPGLKDMPWVGSFFRRVDDTYNEVELIILITPRFVSEVDPSLLPDGPGMETVPPCDNDFFWRGYQEVPRTGSSYQLGVSGEVLRPDFFSPAPVQGNSPSAVQQAPTQNGFRPNPPSTTGYGQNRQPGIPSLDSLPRNSGSADAGFENGNSLPLHDSRSSGIYRPQTGPDTSRSFQALPTNQATFGNYPQNRAATRTGYSNPSPSLPRFHLSDR